MFNINKIQLILITNFKFSDSLRIFVAILE